MYFHILKRDLKRKKTMNMILLLFAILAAMFVSSGLSNVVAVMNGTDYYLDLAGVGDYIVITQGGDGGIREILQDEDCVLKLREDIGFWGTTENVLVQGEAIKSKSNNLEIQKLYQDGMKFFRLDNSELLSIAPGEIYVTVGTLERNGLSIGDEIEIDYHGVHMKLRIAGEIKDALLGSDMMGNTRFLISNEDYEQFDADELAPYQGHIFNVVSNDVSDVKKLVSNGQNVLFSANRGTIRLSYVMEMVMAMLVLVLSVCLCIVSFVLLRFVITFTINEEFREIGVMKAIGIHNIKIRSLYMTKYFAMAVLGGVLGFVAGIPFGQLLIGSVSGKMILGNDYGIALNLVGAVFVICIMTGFAFLCTKKVNRYTPIDAIRNGQTGERYGKRIAMSLKKSHMSNAFFMAVNDVLSAPKRFMTILLTFFLCSVFVFGVVEVTDTMLSDRLISTFGKKSDVYITDSKLMKMEFLSEAGNDSLPESLNAVEKELEALGMPGKASMEVLYNYRVSFNGVEAGFNFQQNKKTKTTDYEYVEGSAPQNSDEIAVTKQIAKELGAEIGDTVEIDFVTEKRECIIVGYFQTMNQLGNMIRLHEDAPTNMIFASGMMSIQIDFDDCPDACVIEERIAKLREYYEIEAIFNAAQYCDDCMKVAGTLSSVKILLLVITCIVVILVTILMERSFISDETGQIALLKSIGFTDGFVIRWQIYRFLFVAVLSELLAVVLTYPVTKLWCDPIWNMMGATKVRYYFDPLSLLVIYPGIILLINLITIWLTALITRRITTRDVGNVE